MEAPKEKTTARKTTEAAKKVRPLIKRIAQQVHEAKAAGVPTSYQFIGCGYDEISRAMGIVPVWTENFAGVCAAKMEAERFISKAETEGYSRTLCTYETVNLGFDAMRQELGGMPEGSPDGGMEKPDIMLGCGTNMCDPRYKAYQAVRRYSDVPQYVHGLLWPAADANLKEVQGRYVRYLAEELRGLIGFLETHLHKKMNYDRLAEIVDLAERTEKTWWDAYQLRRAVPCPMPTEDAMSCMVPGCFMLGTEEALRFYQDLHQELKARVDNKTGVIPNERYRLMWGGGLPPWYALKMFNYYEDLGAVFVIEDTYRPPDPVDLPPQMIDPVERLAWRWFMHWAYWIDKAQKHTGSPDVERLLNFIDDFKIDGVIFHKAITCRTVHVGLMYLVDRLKKWMDLPMMVLEGDIIDVRLFSEVDTKMRIDTFIQMLESRKKPAQATGQP